MAQFGDNFFPDLGSEARSRNAGAIECQPPGFRSFVVATGAIPVYGGAILLRSPKEATGGRGGENESRNTDPNLHHLGLDKLLTHRAYTIATGISRPERLQRGPEPALTPVWPENSIRRIPSSTKGYISVRNFGICESASVPETPRIKQETPKSWTRRIAPARQPFMTDTSVAAVTTTRGQAAAR